METALTTVLLPRVNRPIPSAGDDYSSTPSETGKAGKVATDKTIEGGKLKRIWGADANCNGAYRPMPAVRRLFREATNEQQEQRRNPQTPVVDLVFVSSGSFAVGACEDASSINRQLPFQRFHDDKFFPTSSLPCTHPSPSWHPDYSEFHNRNRGIPR